MIVTQRSKDRVSDRFLRLEWNFAFGEKPLELEKGNMTRNTTVADGPSKVFDLNNEELSQDFFPPPR